MLNQCRKLPFYLSNLDAKILAKSIKRTIEKKHNFPDYLYDVSLEECKEIFALANGFRDKDHLKRFQNRLYNKELINKCSQFISKSFAIFSKKITQYNDKVANKLRVDSHTLSRDLLDCSNSVKIIFEKLEQGRRVSSYDLSRLAYTYCIYYLVTYAGKQTNEYITELLETNFLERLNQLNLEQGIQSLSLSGLQYFFTYQIESPTHVYLLQECRLSSMKELTDDSSAINIIYLLTRCIDKESIPRFGSSIFLRKQLWTDMHKVDDNLCMSDYQMDSYNPFVVDKSLFPFINFASNTSDDFDLIAHIIMKRVQDEKDYCIQHKKFSIHKSFDLVANLTGEKNWHILSKKGRGETLTLVEKSIKFIETYFHFICDNVVTAKENSPSFTSGEPLMHDLDSFKDELKSCSDNLKHIFNQLKNYEPPHKTLLQQLKKNITVYTQHYIYNFCHKAYIEYIEQIWTSRNADDVAYFEPELDLQHKNLYQLHHFIQRSYQSPNIALLLRNTRKYLNKCSSGSLLCHIICTLAFCMMQERYSFLVNQPARPIDFELENKLTTYLCVQKISLI